MKVQQQKKIKYDKPWKLLPSGIYFLYHFSEHATLSCYYNPWCFNETLDDFKMTYFHTNIVHEHEYKTKGFYHSLEVKSSDLRKTTVTVISSLHMRRYCSGTRSI